MDYLIIDSSSLMELDKFPQDIFESLWGVFYNLFEDKNMFSVKDAWKELKDSKEMWKAYEDCFRDITDEESKYVTYILSSSKFEVFVRHGKDENDEWWADPYLIACAMAKDDSIIITEENLNNKPKRKIPYVCNELNKKGCNIRCMSLFDFLRYKKIKF